MSKKLVLGPGLVEPLDEPKRVGGRCEFMEVRSSGEKDTMASGAVRDKRAGKGRYDLISPIATRRLALHHEHGISSGGYAPRNWEKGIPLHMYLDSAKRHIDKCIEDRIRGRTSEEDNIAAAVWNLNCYMHTEELIAAAELPAELDDILTEKLPEADVDESRELGASFIGRGAARPVASEIPTGKDRGVV